MFLGIGMPFFFWAKGPYMVVFKINGLLLIGRFWQHTVGEVWEGFFWWAEGIENADINSTINLVNKTCL
jgi:hypothetical protein